MFWLFFWGLILVIYNQIGENQKVQLVALKILSVNMLKHYKNFQNHENNFDVNTVKRRSFQE